MKITNSQLKKLDPLFRLPASIRYLFRYQRPTLAELESAAVIVAKMKPRGRNEALA